MFNLFFIPAQVVHRGFLALNVGMCSLVKSCAIANSKLCVMCILNETLQASKVL